MDVNLYLSNIENMANEILNANIVRTGEIEIYEPYKITEEMLKRIIGLKDIKKQLITPNERRIADIVRIRSIDNLDISNEDKIMLISIYNDVRQAANDKEFVRSFELYDTRHPIFVGNNLFNHVRECRELIDYNALEWIKLSDYCKFEDKFYQPNVYIKKEMLEFISDIGSEYKKYIRLEPYCYFEKLPPKYLKEEALRPVNPEWIKELRLYRGQSTGGHYILQEISEINSELDRRKWWDYDILGVRNLEIHAQRNNSGNLSMMIEEIKKYDENKNYFATKCIHLDTNDNIGTSFNNSYLNHIDCAINVYDNRAMKERILQSLSNGRVVDATFRTHILRFENVPFTFLLNLSSLFFDSVALTQEWITDQFG